MNNEELTKILYDNIESIKEEIRTLWGKIGDHSDEIKDLTDRINDIEGVCR